jgi:uncharacterized protein YbjT (DUF2867 family)
MRLENKKVVVFGAAGLIGSNALDLLTTTS